MPNYALTNAGELVEEGHPEAAYHVHSEGTEVDEERLDALKPGLARELRAKLRGDKTEDKAEEPEAKPEPQAEEPVKSEAKAEDKVQDKAIDGPPENKAAGRSR